jgi:hypothetical protein
MASAAAADASLTAATDAAAADSTPTSAAAANATLSQPAIAHLKAELDAEKTRNGVPLTNAQFSEKLDAMEAYAKEVKRPCYKKKLLGYVAKKRQRLMDRMNINAHTDAAAERVIQRVDRLEQHQDERFDRLDAAVQPLQPLADALLPQPGQKPVEQLAAHRAHIAVLRAQTPVLVQKVQEQKYKDKQAALTARAKAAAPGASTASTADAAPAVNQPEVVRRREAGRE